MTETKFSFYLYPVLELGKDTCHYQDLLETLVTVDHLSILSSDGLTACTHITAKKLFITNLLELLFVPLSDPPRPLYTRSYSTSFCLVTRRGCI